MIFIHWSKQIKQWNWHFMGYIHVYIYALHIVCIELLMWKFIFKRLVWCPLQSERGIQWCDLSIKTISLVPAELFNATVPPGRRGGEGVGLLYMACWSNYHPFRKDLCNYINTLPRKDSLFTLHGNNAFSLSWQNMTAQHNHRMWFHIATHNEPRRLAHGLELHIIPIMKRGYHCYQWHGLLSSIL